MSVRVVARIRPLLKQELDKDTIVSAASTSSEPTSSPNTVRIPNPKNEVEAYSFQFNSVYDQEATQQQIFENEVAPTIKHLLKGFDITLFAYGVTGTGKTHTMRGGKSLADRGVIPRMLSGIYRRSRKIEKDSAGETRVEVVMSYYEIYNDRVYDLFEPPEKRTPAGLPIRDNGGKTVVVGLTERPCTSLKEFEQLYDEANVNRSTSATKLNAHSSRSHAILCVKVTQITGDQVRVSTASAIDLAGSEDNRRTDNGKERMVESASINKSLFVLASCVEAISRKAIRIPYRESKMTRILSLGQNNGLTVMILNLAPVRSYHLDTLSSLNFANRTKKIEVNEIENHPFMRAKAITDVHGGNSSAPAMNRQPLRPKAFSANVVPKELPSKTDKPVKSFSVYSDKARPPAPRTAHLAGQGFTRTVDPQKRKSSEAIPTLGRHTKAMRPNDLGRSGFPGPPAMTQESIEELIERKVTEKLAETALNSHPGDANEKAVSAAVQARLDALEKRVEGHETERAEGLQYLLMAKQHQVRGEDVSALKMYQLALPFFPGNERLCKKMLTLQEKIRRKKEEKEGETRDDSAVMMQPKEIAVERAGKPTVTNKPRDDDDEDYEYDPTAHHDDDQDYESDFQYRKAKKPVRRNLKVFRDITQEEAPQSGTDSEDVKHTQHASSDSEDELAPALGLHSDPQQTPRTKQLLRIINTRDVSQIRLLRGVGAKKAEAIVNCLCEMGEDNDGLYLVRDLGDLERLKGVGLKGVEKMREGLIVAV